MPNLTADTRAADIIESARAAIAAVQVSGVAVFGSVLVYDEADSFDRVASVDTKPAAALIIGVQEEQPSIDNGAARVKRLPMQAVFKFQLGRAQQKTEQAAAAEMQRLADLIRQGLAIDITRGGRADRWFQWSGEVLDGTDLRGAAAMLPHEPNCKTYLATLPVVCGWEG